MCAQSIEGSVKISELRKMRMYFALIAADVVLYKKEFEPQHLDFSTHLESSGHGKFCKKLKQLTDSELQIYLSLVELYSDKEGWYDSSIIAEKQHRKKNYRSVILRYFNSKGNSKNNRGSITLRKLISTKKINVKKRRRFKRKITYFDRSITGFQPRGFIKNLCHLYANLNSLVIALDLYSKIRIEHHGSIYDPYGKSLLEKVESVKEKLRKIRPAAWLKYVYKNEPDFRILVSTYQKVYSQIWHVKDLISIDYQNHFNSIRNNIAKGIERETLDEVANNFKEFSDKIDSIRDLIKIDLEKIMKKLQSSLVEKARVETYEEEVRTLLKELYGHESDDYLIDLENILDEKGIPDLEAYNPWVEN